MKVPAKSQSQLRLYWGNTYFQANWMFHFLIAVEFMRNDFFKARNRGQVPAALSLTSIYFFHPQWGATGRRGLVGRFLGHWKVVLIGSLEFSGQHCYKRIKPCPHWALSAPGSRCNHLLAPETCSCHYCIPGHEVTRLRWGLVCVIRFGLFSFQNGELKWTSFFFLNGLSGISL